MNDFHPVHVTYFCGPPLWQAFIFNHPEPLDRTKLVEKAVLVKQILKSEKRDLSCQFLPVPDIEGAESMVILCKIKGVYVRSEPATCGRSRKRETRLEFEFPGEDGKVNINTGITAVSLACKEW